MNRTGLIIALAIGGVVGLIFGLFPQLDLLISAPFHPIYDAAHNTFALHLYPSVQLARDAGLWVGTVLVAPAVGTIVIKLIWPRWKMLVSARAALFLMLTMALAPGLLANVILKDHWGRPRPIDVTQFGGGEHFVPWWDPRGDCPNNCSFVSGDVSGAFWTLAPAALTPPQWRALAYGGALALGLGMAAIRIVSGAHFFTDAVFAGVFTYLIIWIVHGLIFRWPRTRLSEDRLERALERISLPASIAALTGRKTKLEP